MAAIASLVQRNGAENAFRPVDEYSHMFRFLKASEAKTRIPSMVADEEDSHRDKNAAHRAPAKSLHPSLV